MKVTTEVKNKIKEIAKELTGYDYEVQDTDDLQKDLGMDSLDIVEFIMALEKEFDIMIPDNEIEKVDTFEDLFKLLETL